MKCIWTAAELAEHWTLQPDELALVGTKAGATAASLCDQGRAGICGLLCGW